MLDVVYRRGDVVCFRRGSNEYVGTISKISPVMGGFIVKVTDGPVSALGMWTVAFKSILRIEVPVLTEKERAALLELVPESRGATVASLNGLRRGRGDESLLSGTTMHGLAQRGLIVGERKGVVTASGAFAWRLTEEGRRVARAL